MKKFFSILILLISLFVGNVYAEELVSIENIKCDNVFNGNLIENMEVSKDGLNLKVEDANFHNINDYLECSLSIKNTSDNTLSIDEVNFNNKTDEYVKYELIYEDVNKILKDDVKTYQLKVTYQKEFEEDIDLENKLSIKVSYDKQAVEEEVENPKTGLPTYTAIIVTIGALGCTLVFLKYKKVGPFKTLSVLLFLSILIPITVNALVSNVITLDSNIHVSVDKYYNVAINPNGGLFNGSNEIYQKRVLVGTEIDLTDIKRDNFDFVLWELNGIETFKDNKIIINKDTTLKAVWNEIFTLEIDPNGGLFNDDTNIYTEKVFGGTEIDISNIKYDGYVFSHWLLNGKDKYTEKKIVVTDNTTVKAIWLKAYNLTIDPNGGLYNGKSEVFHATVAEGTEIDLTDIYKEKYIVGDWTLNETEKYTGNKITITEDTTLVANWIVAVARIEQKYYASIMKAHEAAKTNDTIVLLIDTEEIVTSTKTVTLDLDGHKVTGYITNTGNLTIINGTIECLDGAAVRNTGTLTLGENDLNGEGKPNVSIDSVALIGTDVGLSQKGTFNFYDGFIEGKIGLDGGYNDKPVGYIVFVDHNDQKDCQKVYLVPEELVSRAVAKTIIGGEIYYFNLQDALNSGMFSDLTVYAIRDFEAAHTLTIPKGEEVIFDIIGFNVEPGNDIFVEGTFTITDTGEPKGLLKPSITMTNRGTLNIKDITITPTTDIDVITNYADLNITNTTINAQEQHAIYNIKGNIKLDDNTYLKANKYAIYNYFAENVDPAPETTITGGNIFGIDNNYNGTVIINDATITGASEGIKNYNTKLIVNNSEIKDVPKGILNGATAELNNLNITVTGLSIDAAAGKVTINGGNYTSTNNSTLSTTDADMIINSGTITSLTNSATVFREGDSVINGGTFIGKTNGVYQSYRKDGIYARTGTVTINGGNISGEAQGVYVTMGTMYIAGGNITSQKYGVRNESTCNIFGATVHGDIYGYYQTEGKTTIGTDDEEISAITPQIIGETYGFYNENGEINFYDGILKGQTDSLYGMFTKTSAIGFIKEDTETIDGNVYKRKYLIKQQNFVKVGDVEFNSLQAAIDSIENTGTIEFIADATSGGAVLTPIDKTITIDLKGYTYDTSQPINNEGTLTIKDSSTNETGKINVTSSIRVNGIYNNRGKLYFESGSIAVTSEAEATGIFNYLGTVEITKGNITVNAVKKAIGLHINSQSTNIANDLTIISRSETHEAMGINNGGKAKLELTNSNISAYNKGTQKCYGVFIDNGVVNIDNTEVNAFSDAGYSHGICIYSGATVAINNSNINATSESSKSYGLHNNKAYTIVDIVDSTIKATSISDTEASHGIYSLNDSSNPLADVTVNITNSTIEGIGTNSYGIYNSGAGYKKITNIISGTIKGNKYGIYLGEKTPSLSALTMGEDDDDVSITSPTIIGGEYGIYIDSGDVNFYDGILKGVTAGYYGTISGTADATSIKSGKETIETVEYQTNYLVKQATFAKVNGVEYNSLQKAIDSITDTGVIEFIADATSTNTVNIPVGKKITIDLKGYTYNTSQEFTNEGTLTIKDSNTSKTGVININALSSVKGIDNRENAVFNFDSGRIAVTAPADSYGIYNNGTTNVKEGILSINLQSFVAYGIYNTDIGTLNMMGGEVIAHSVTNDSNAIYNKQGTIFIDSTKINASTTSNSNSDRATAIYIEGGNSTIINSTITATTSDSKAFSDGLYLKGGTVNITGGTINSDDNGIFSRFGTADITLTDVDLNVYSKTGPVYGIFAYTKATVNVIDSSIKAKTDSTTNAAYGIYNNNDSKTSGTYVTTNITNSTIEGIGTTSYGIYHTEKGYKMTTNVNSGTVKGSIYGIYLSDGQNKENTLSLGENNADLSLTSPTIIGGTYGVYVNSGNVNFYDGIIKGQAGGYYGDIKSTSDGMIVVSGTETVDAVEYQTNYLVEETNVVQNGDKTYVNVQTAINEATSGDTLTIIKNSDIYYPIAIPADKEITLDLNGYSLNMSHTITNPSTLHIINSSSNKSTIKETEYEYLINNTGVLTIDNVEIIGTKNQYAIYNNSAEAVTITNTSMNCLMGIDNVKTANLTLDNVTIVATGTAVNNLGIVRIENSDIATGLDKYALYLNTTQETIINNTKFVGRLYNNAAGNVTIENLDMTGEITNRSAVFNITEGITDGGIINNGTMALKDLELKYILDTESSGTIINNTKNMTITNSSMYMKKTFTTSVGGNLTFITNSGALTLNDMLDCTIIDNDKTFDVYGIKNTGTGTITAENFNMNITSYRKIYGIHNTSSKDITIDNLNININIPETTLVDNSYGIYNAGTGTISSNTLNINVNSESTNNSSKSYGIYSNKDGIISMKDGNIIVNNPKVAYGIYINVGSVTIGEAESTDSPNYGTENANVSTTNPLVQAVGTTTGIGVKKVNGYFNFYDGKIIGSTNAKPDTTSSVEYNYEATTHIDPDTGYEYCVLEYLK